MHVKNIISEIYNLLDNMIISDMLKDHKVYIWGVSKASYISAQYLIKKGVDVVSVIDNDRKLWGNISYQLQNYTETFKQLLVVSPEVLKNSPTNTKVLVFSRAYPAIKTQAISLGIQSENCIHTYSPEKFLTLNDLNGLTEISVNERKTIQYDILKYLKYVCEKNNIRYYLAAGTLLGAVRHNGYIPWDDDIDVYMPWPDYKKLIELFKLGKEGNDIYSLKYYSLTDNFSWIYAKLQDNRTIARGIRFPLVCDIGINIDIFPMGGIPNDENKLSELKEMVSNFQSHWANHLKTFHDGVNTKEIADYIDKIMSMYDFDASPYVGYFINGYWSWEMHSYSAYKPIQLFFENDYFTAPSGYDEVLTHSYGDYMQLPPNWQTIQFPHTYRAFWRNQ